MNTSTIITTRNVQIIFNYLTLILGLVAIYLVFMVVPNERIMGAVQRIFYFHVGTALACYGLVATLLVGSLMYLAQRSVVADAIMIASVEIGLLLASIVILTGSIWGHSAWNTWFRWEPRLVSFLILWIILLVMKIMRRYIDSSKVAAQSAIVGILAAINVPLVVFSVKLLPQSAQLHPQVLANNGLKDPSYVWAFVISTLALCTLAASMFLVRLRMELLERSKGAASF